MHVNYVNRVSYVTIMSQYVTIVSKVSYCVPIVSDKFFSPLSSAA